MLEPLTAYSNGERLRWASSWTSQCAWPIGLVCTVDSSSLGVASPGKLPNISKMVVSAAKMLSSVWDTLTCHSLSGYLQCG